MQGVTLYCLPGLPSPRCRPALLGKAWARRRWASGRRPLVRLAGGIFSLFREAMQSDVVHRVLLMRVSFLCYLDVQDKVRPTFPGLEVRYSPLGDS